MHITQRKIKIIMLDERSQTEECAHYDSSYINSRKYKPIYKDTNPSVVAWGADRELRQEGTTGE